MLLGRGSVSDESMSLGQTQIRCRPRACQSSWFGHIQDAVSDFEQARTISERVDDLFRRYLDDAIGLTVMAPQVYPGRGEPYRRDRAFAFFDPLFARPALAMVEAASASSSGAAPASCARLQSAQTVVCTIADRQIKTLRF